MGEKQAVNRLSIIIVFIVSMSQKQSMETTSPSMDLRNLFPKSFFVTLRIGLYFPFSYLENGSIKIARSLGVRDDDGKPKKVSGQKTGKWFSHPAKGDLKCWKVIRKWFTILLLIN